MCRRKSENILVTKSKKNLDDQLDDKIWSPSKSTNKNHKATMWKQKQKTQQWHECKILNIIIIVKTETV